MELYRIKTKIVGVEGKYTDPLTTTTTTVITYQLLILHSKHARYTSTYYYHGFI